MRTEHVPSPYDEPPADSLAKWISRRNPVELIVMGVSLVILIWFATTAPGRLDALKADMEREQQEWAQFKEDHHCTKGRSVTDYHRVGYITNTSTRTEWICDNGTYWR